ncbi:MAG: phosphoenolpyruvate synthase [bacterium ADurb.Bin236]|nr:MAG: phosphoenolpyruvate synthase [bacterium ADurb.Bin236]HPN94723.1 PEP/pyruvate-binding domain-containing protein [bacterium]
MTDFLYDMTFPLFIALIGEIASRAAEAWTAGRGFGVFFAGLFSMPVAAGAFIAAALTVLIAALLVPMAALLGFGSGKWMFTLGAAILLAAVWALSRAVGALLRRVPVRDSDILDYSSAARAGLDLVGFKGKWMGELFRLGFNVPRGFIISGTVFEKWTEAEGLRKEILRIEGTEDAEEKIVEIFKGVRPPRGFVRKLKKELRALRGGRIIARSSFPGEDGRTASMAGVFESLSAGRGADEALAAIIRVWASYYCARAVAAADNAGASRASFRLPVIVQKKIVHEIFLVGCSANYMNGFMEETVVSYEAADGLEGVIVRNAFTGAERTESGPATHPVDPAALSALEDAMARMEALFGRPAQMEAGLLNGNLYFYQARPLTGFQPVETLVNSFIVDIADFPPSTLTRDLFDLPDGMSRRMSAKLAPLGMPRGETLFAEHKGRFYLKYNSVRACLNPHNTARAKASARALAPAAAESARIFSGRGFKRRLSLLDARLKAAARDEDCSVRYLKNSVLLPLFRLQLDLFETSDMLAGRRAAFLARALADKRDALAAAAGINIAPPDSPWKKMIQAAARVDPADAAQVDAFRAEYGHWGNPEAEVAAPRLADDPAPWLSARGGAGDAGDAGARGGAADSSQQRVERALKEKWSGNFVNAGLLVLRFMLRRQRETMAARERARDCLNRAVFEIRKRALASEFGADSFHMTIDEMSRGGLRDWEIARRKEEHEKRLSESAGAVVHIPEPEAAAGAADGELRGLGVGSETARGRALVAGGRLPDLGGDMPVLIVGRPDGVYGAAVGRISALVIERGSPLSHLVLLAREASIPVLIGVEGAMSKVKNGDDATVDAGKGVLRIG